MNFKSIRRKIFKCCLTMVFIFLALLGYLAWDIFVRRPTGIYSTISDPKLGIGLTKEAFIEEIKAGHFFPYLRRIASREPYSSYYRYGGDEWDIDNNLFLSDFWSIVTAGDKHIILFENGVAVRVLTSVTRFGELDGTPGLFRTKKGSANVFKGMTEAEVDEYLMNYAPGRIDVFFED